MPDPFIQAANLQFVVNGICGVGPENRIEQQKEVLLGCFYHICHACWSIV